MAQKYRKIDPRIWDDEKFSGMTPLEKLGALRSITHNAFEAGFERYAGPVFRSRDPLAPKRRRPDLCSSSWRKLRKVVIARDGTTCTYCGEDCSLDPTVDHKVAVCMGGALFDENNLVVACRRCNSAKGGRDRHRA